MQLQNLNDLFIIELQDLYDAEQRILKALPQMIVATTDKNLKEAFKEHYQVTQQHADRIERICMDLSVDMQGKSCVGMQGVLKEGEEVLAYKTTPEVTDAALIAAAQRVEHYEIAGYGTVVAYAQLLGYKDAEKMLKQTLTEEKQADKKLSMLAESSINKEAQHSNRHSSFMNMH